MKINNYILKSLLIVLMMACSSTFCLSQSKAAPKAKANKTASKSKTAKPIAKSSRKKKKSKETDEDADLFNSKGKRKKGAKTNSGDGKVVDTRSLLKGKVNINGRKSSGGSSANGGSLYRPLYIGKKLVTGNIVTAQGFRICIYNGTNRDSAMAIKLAFMKSHKNFNSYMSYNMPYYRIKVGDWDDKKTTQKMLKEIAKVYPVSFIVPDAVTKKNILVYKSY